MRQYWQATIKHCKETEGGKIKKTNSVYLVDAVNHTEVEAILTKKAEQFIKGDFTIKPITPSDVSQLLVDSSCGKYFKLKYEFEVEKKVTETMLIEAESAKEALDCFTKESETWFIDLEVVSIARTKILDVYDFQAEGDSDIEFIAHWTDGVSEGENPFPESTEAGLSADDTYSATLTEDDIYTDNTEWPEVKTDEVVGTILESRDLNLENVEMISDEEFKSEFYNDDDREDDAP